MDASVGCRMQGEVFVDVFGLFEFATHIDGRVSRAGEFHDWQWWSMAVTTMAMRYLPQAVVEAHGLTSTGRACQSSSALVALEVSQRTQAQGRRWLMVDVADRGKSPGQQLNRLVVVKI